MSIETCKSPLNQTEKIYIMQYAFRLSLWEKPEAVKMGFHLWMKENFKERIESIEYHNKNGDSNEGKEPQIYKK